MNLVVKNRLVLLFGFVFIDLLGYSLFLPLLPFYVADLGGTPAMVGVLVASNALAQFFGGPIIGRLSDRFGRRPLLILSISGTLAGFLLLGLAEPLGDLLAGLSPDSISVGGGTLLVLFFSRILDGLLGGDVALARAYITDVTDEKNRAKGLGLIGAAFGMGFIIGPAMGGTLANWDYAVSAFASAGLSRYAVPAFAAVLLSALNLLAVVLLLPESLPPNRREELASSPRSAFSARCLWKCISRPRFGTLLRVRFLYSVAFTIFTANFALYAQYQLRLTDRATSYILTYVGILVVLVQGIAIGRLSARYTERRLILVGVSILGMTLLAWAFVPSLWPLMLVLTAFPLAGGVLNTVTNSAITKSVYAEEVGGALGLSSSLDSMARVIASTMGGFLLQQMGGGSLGLAGAVIMAFVAFHVWRRLIVNPDPHLPDRAQEEISR
jgi:DHA1 family tetracycline resistance protein-like MFS transporter